MEQREEEDEAVRQLQQKEIKSSPQAPRLIDLVGKFIQKHHDHVILRDIGLGALVLALVVILVVGLIFVFSLPFANYVLFLILGVIIAWLIGYFARTIRHKILNKENHLDE